MKKLIAISMLVVVFCVGFYAGGLYPHQSEREYQTSEFQTRETMGDSLLKILCLQNNIDYDNDSFVFSCPKCVMGGGRIQQSLTGSLYYGFITTYPELEKLASGESVVLGSDQSQTYCNKCRYPIGTDWNIIKL